MPGTAALNKGGNADVNSVSCARVGSCGAGGFYTDRRGHVQAFVVSEKRGRWRNAQDVPGLAALNAGGNAQVTSFSCPSAGDCVAAGFDTDGHGHVQAFVVTEKNGHWYKAVEVPGPAAMNAAGYAVVNSVSCSRGGNCGAGGSYASGVDTFFGQNIVEAFVVSEKNGIWRAALQVPGTAAQNPGEDAQVSPVSCPAGGNCSAGGYYIDRRSGHSEAFASSENK